MKRLAKLMEKIKERPGLYLERMSLELLGAFIDGYMICKMETDIHADFYPGFQEFVEKRYNRKRGMDHYDTIIQSESESDEQAFYKFFELLDEFRESQNKEE